MTPLPSPLFLHRICAALFLLLLAPCLFADVRVANLKVDNLVRPVGVDTAKPFFSWQMSDTDLTPGQKQTAYRLRVFRSADSSGLVWDTGKVPSAQSINVEYQGAPLTSSSQYLWLVSVWDKDGKETRFETATFITGLLNRSDWDGSQWLKHPTAAQNKTIWFRKKFNVTAKENRLNLVHIACLGYHELYINGQKVDDSVLAPPLVDYFKRIPYKTYDVTSFLKPGENVIAVWSAPGWTVDKGFAKFNKSFSFRLQTNFGVQSNADWKCSESDTEETNVKTKVHEFGGERLDARKSQPGWNTLTFDDSQWQAPRIMPDFPQPITSIVNVPASRIIETFKPKEIKRNSDDSYTIVFPKNFTGWLSFKPKGLDAGDTLTILTADDLQTVCDYKQKSFFISSGKDGEEFRYRFNYAAGLHWTVQGLKKDQTLEDIVGYAIGTAFEQTATFKSSNELYNKIYELDLWTFRTTTPQGVTQDCPHRERMGYGEVATATSWGIGIPNYDTAAFYRQIVQNWIDVQDPNGCLPHVAPVPEHQHWGGPMWCSAGLNVAREHYLNFGDKRIAEAAYPMSKRWLDFLHKNTKDGILVPYQGPPKFLGDWLAPASRSEFGGKPQASYFNNCVYAWNLQEFLDFATLLGKTEDVEIYTKRLADLKAAINKKYYKPETGVYMDGGQVQQAFALFANINGNEKENDKVRKQLFKAFADKPYFDMGSSGLPVLLHYMTEHPAETGEVAAEFLNKTNYPSYGYFIARGETTHPEDWKVDVESRIHTCYTGIAAWFIKSLGGIRPESPDTFIIQPAFVKGTDWAETSVESPYGKISTSWKRSDGHIELTVVVPPNSKAKVILPGKEPQNVESGKHLFRF